MRRTASIALLLLASVAPAHAGIDRAGTTSANFLSIGSGASILGMGGATLGAPAGLDGVLWNPASLGWLGQTEVAFSHAGLAAQSQQEYAAVGGGFGRTRWALSGLYQGDGSFEGRDAFNNPTGGFSASSLAIGAQAAHALTTNVSVGGGVRYVSEALGDVHGSGVAFDAGIQVRAGRFGFGAALQNTGPGMTYDGVKYPFPSNIGVGVSMIEPASGLRFVLDANVPNAYYSDVRGGVEWRYRDRIALRTGYRAELGADAGEPLSGPTFGLGTGMNGFWFDYGLVVGGAGDSQHRLGLSFKPGLMNLGVPGSPTARESMGPSLPPAPSVEPERATKKKSREETPAPAPEKSRASEAQAESPKPAKSAPLSVAPIVPAPVAAKPVETPKSEPAKAEAPAPSKTVEAPKPAPVVVKPVETPKSEPPKFSDPAPKPVEAPKPEPEPAKVEPAKPEPAKVEPAPQLKIETAEAPKPSASEKPAEVAKPVEAPKPAPAKVAPAKPEEPRPTQITVKKGETLEDLAKRWDTSVAALMMENNLVTQKAPKPGTKLKLPAKR